MSKWRMGEKKRTVIVVPTLLGEMQLPLYLRGDGKGRAFGEVLEQKKLSNLPQYDSSIGIRDNIRELPEILLYHQNYLLCTSFIEQIKPYTSR
jgi:hypothetical protein